MRTIFCLEGEWDSSIESRETVLPILELLDGLQLVKHFHRHAISRHEFEYHLSKFKETTADCFPVLYLACHGEEGGIDLGTGGLISLEDLSEMLAGDLADRAVYFGSCLIGSAKDEELAGFIRKTKARSVIGFDTSVDWLESAAFDLLVLGRLTDVSRGDAVFNGLMKTNATLAESLGLVVATRSKVFRARN